MYTCISGVNHKAGGADVTIVLVLPHLSEGQHSLEAWQLIFQGLPTKVKWDSGHFNQRSNQTMFSYCQVQIGSKKVGFMFEKLYMRLCGSHEKVLGDFRVGGILQRNN